MRKPTKDQQIAELTEQLRASRAISEALRHELCGVYKTIELQAGMSGKADLTKREKNILKAAIQPESKVAHTKNQDHQQWGLL